MPQIHIITVSLPTLGTGNDSCLTATHEHGTYGSTLVVKNNIAAPTGKLHGEVRHNELEFGLFPLSRCATGSLIPFLIMCTN